MRLADGDTFADYAILRRLGRGGMATVFLAKQSVPVRLVALKFLGEELSEDPGFTERFAREVQVLASLDHPNIVPIYASGIFDRVPWMALRFVDGMTLAERLKALPLPTAEGISILQAVASALDYAHSKGVVHRDVKPQNILISNSGAVYLADFGIAKILETKNPLTATGAIIGTPEYMAPEQAMGKGIGPATDIYALAVIGFEWLSGQRPFQADTPLAVLLKHVQDALPIRPLAALPIPVAEVLRRGLAKIPSDRQLTAGDFVASLADGLGKTESITVSSTPLQCSERSGTPPNGSNGNLRSELGRRRLSRTLQTVTLASVIVLAGGILLAWQWQVSSTKRQRSEQQLWESNAQAPDMMQAESTNTTQGYAHFASRWPQAANPSVPQSRKATTGAEAKNQAADKPDEKLSRARTDEAIASKAHDDSTLRSPESSHRKEADSSNEQQEAQGQSQAKVESKEFMAGQQAQSIDSTHANAEYLRHGPEYRQAQDSRSRIVQLGSNKSQHAVSSDIEAIARFEKVNAGTVAEGVRDNDQRLIWTLGYRAQMSWAAAIRYCEVAGRKLPTVEQVRKVKSSGEWKSLLGIGLNDQYWTASQWRTAGFALAFDGNGDDRPKPMRAAIYVVCVEGL